MATGSAVIVIELVAVTVVAECHVSDVDDGPVRVSHAVSPGMIPARNAGMFGDDLQHLAVDDQNVHLVWADSRSGFQGVWYGRVPIEAYTPR